MKVENAGRYPNVVRIIPPPSNTFHSNSVKGLNLWGKKVPP